MENNNTRRALRLPEFWVTDPVAWFAHVEAHFELENQAWANLDQTPYDLYTTLFRDPSATLFTQI